MGVSRVAKIVEQGKAAKPPSVVPRRGREIMAVLLFAVGVFTWLSLHTESVGIVGLWVGRYARWLLGLAADLPVLLFLLAGWRCIRGKGKDPAFGRFLTGLGLLIAALLILIHLQTTDNVAASYIRYSREWLSSPRGTGVIGQYLTLVSLRAFGLSGTYVLIAACLMISAILLFDVPLFKSVLGVGSWVGRKAASVWRDVKQTWTAAITGVSSWRRRTPRKAADGKSREAKKAAQPAPKGGSRRPNGQAQSQVIQEVAASREEGPPSQLVKAEGDAQQEDPGVSLSQPRRIGPFTMPPLDLVRASRIRRSRRQSSDQTDLLETTLANFGIDAHVVDVSHGPTVTRYEVQPPPGIKVSRIVALADDLALALAAPDVRIEAPVPGKSVVGVEVPNREPSPVYLQDVLESAEFQSHPSCLAMALGKDIAGNPVIADLKKLPHLLVAGATGSGKSVCLNAMIASFLYKSSPEQVQLLLIDPKRVELTVYNGIPHLICPVVTDPKKAAGALRWAVKEMERRYELFADAGARNIESYNKWMADNRERYGEGELLPYIVVIIDELADLMMVAAADVEDSICRLAQMARAAGMCLIIATQRPSVDVITGLIKANIPSRIAFAVSSQVDSRTILDMAGAERLLGKGDMLYFPVGASKAIRAQGALVMDKEIEKLVSFWSQQADPDAQEDSIVDLQESVDREVSVEDELFDDAVRLVIDSGQASISMLQRRFRIGYSRAARLIDAMELKGIVGPHQGSKPREVLVDDYEDAAVGGDS
ncbi:MAG: DNA translocase FtsK [Firmicutes bacterium]|nr:DNA translocase FtsK [Bacillota bacterium]